MVCDGELWLGSNPRNGVAVVTGSGVEAKVGPLEPTAPWSIVPLVVSGVVRLNVLMVWTRQEHKYLHGLDLAITTYAAFLREAPCVVLGDFNANAIWDKPKRPTDFSRIARRLTDDFGLLSAYHACTGEPYGAESRATHYFWRQSGRPFHIDYCFVPASWLPHLRVEIPDFGPWAKLSDHRPVIVEWSGGVV